MDLSFFKVKKCSVDSAADVNVSSAIQYTGLDNLWSLISDLGIKRVNIQRRMSIE